MLSLHIGDMLTFVLQAVNLGFTADGLTRSYSDMRASLAPCRTVLQLIEQGKRAEAAKTKGARPDLSKMEVVLEDVDFHYPSRPLEPVLKGVSLTIHAGETVALVG